MSVSRYTLKEEEDMPFIYEYILDSCKVNNGGCDPNAMCSHAPANNAVRCACKPGYKNVGIATAVRCRGLIPIR